MQLHAWLEAQGKTQSEFAADIGCAISTISRLCALCIGRDDDLKRRVYIATRGAVTPNDFYDLPELPGPSGAAEGAGAGE